MTPVGLLGLFTMTARVFSVMAASNAARSSLKLGFSDGTGFSTPP